MTKPEPKEIIEKIPFVKLKAHLDKHGLEVERFYYSHADGQMHVLTKRAAQGDTKETDQDETSDM
jgi:hypothetical protein